MQVVPKSHKSSGPLRVPAPPTSLVALPERCGRSRITHHNTSLPQDAQSGQTARASYGGLGSGLSLGGSFRSQGPQDSPRCLAVLCPPRAGGELGESGAKGRRCTARSKALHGHTQVVVSTVTAATPAAVPPLTKNGASFLPVLKSILTSSFQYEQLRQQLETDAGSKRHSPARLKAFVSFFLTSH